MASIFKCLIELNEKNLSKVRICINRNINKITFAEVYNKIKETHGLEYISFNTHYFEIFDKDFGVYIKILDKTDTIDNLANIRVIPKYSINNIDENSGNPSTSQAEYSAPKTPTNSRLSQTLVIEQNNSVINKQTKTQPIRQRTIQEFFKNKNTNQVLQSSQTINDSETGFETNETSELKKILEKDLTPFKIRTMEAMIAIINENMQNFIENHLDFNNWILVSIKMKNKGFHSFNPLKCKKDFLYFASIYKKVLECVPNYEKACGLYSLFMSFHTMDLSPFYVTAKLSFKNLCLLKENFELKQQSIINRCESCASNTPQNSQTSQNSNTSQFETIENPDLKNILNHDLTPFKIKILETMIRIIKENKQLFIEKHLDISNWIIVSNHMKANGFDSNDPFKCRRDFLNFANVYKKIMEYLENNETAFSLYSLFNLFHSIDLRPFCATTNQTFESLSLLREKLALKQLSVQFGCYSVTQLNPDITESITDQKQDNQDIQDEIDIILISDSLYGRMNEYERESERPSKKLKF